MSASDHLNVHQWPVEEVGKLRSGNRPGLSVDEEYAAYSRGDYTDADHEHAQVYGFRDAGHYQDALDQHIASHGLRTPSYWGPGEKDLGEDPNDRVLVNGAHRYASARNLGLRTMPVARYPKGQTAKQPRVPGWTGGR